MSFLTLCLSSTAQDEHAGNWAFMDQVAALVWVQENIEFFGWGPTLRDHLRLGQQER